MTSLVDRIQGLSGSLAVKAPVRVATTANITLNGLQTVDGVVLVAGDRVLVRAQTDTAENGVYDASTSDWARSLDFNGSGDVVNGSLVVVMSGTVGGGKIWKAAGADPILPGTSLLTFSSVIDFTDLPTISAFMANVLGLATADEVRGEIVAAKSGANDDITSLASPALGAATADTQLPGDASDKVATTDFVAAATAISSVLNVPVRQTVLGGPVDSYGIPNFLPATDADFNLASQNITSSAPLVVTAANGFTLVGGNDRIGISETNITWTGLPANSTSFLYVDVGANGALTTGHTVLAPNYQTGGTYSGTANQATFNITEKVMKVAGVQTWRVFVGEAVTNGTGVTGTVCYAYCGIFRSTPITPLPGTSTLIQASHNLGVKPRWHEFLVKNITTEYGFAPEDETPVQGLTNGSDYINGGNSNVSGRNTIQYKTGAGSAFRLVSVESTAQIRDLTAAYWSYFFVAERGW